jgi:hypothetical protein
MPLPTRRASSAPASPGGQISKAGAGAIAVLLAVVMAVPVVAVGAPAEGSTAERSTLGGTESDMMFVEGVDIGKAAGGATLEAPVLDWEIEVVDVEPVVAVKPVALALVAAADVLALEAADALGNGIAPEVAAGWAPGASGGGPVVVVAMVDGDVDVVAVADVEDVDCASAGPASPTTSAAVSASLPGATAISAPA